MRPASALVVLVLSLLAGCGALGGPAEPTPTLTPAAVPTAEPAARGPTTATATARPATTPAPVVVENARGRAYAITLSTVDGPVTAVEVVHADGRSAVVELSAEPAALGERLSAGSVVDVRVPERAGTAQYRVAANTSLARRPFEALSRASSPTSVVWVVEPAEGTRVVAAGVDACAPPHSLVTEFRVRVSLGDRITVDCA